MSMTLLWALICLIIFVVVLAHPKLPNWMTFICMAPVVLLAKVMEAKDIYASFEVEELPQGFASVVVYNLTKEYEITPQGLRRWKKDGGWIRAYYCPKGKAFEMAYVDEVEPEAALVFA